MPLLGTLGSGSVRSFGLIPVLPPVINTSPQFIGATTLGDAAGDFTLDISSLDIQNGDLGILFTGSDDGAPFTVDGFTNRARVGVSGGGGAGDATVFTKVMNGSESSLVSSGGTGLNQTAIIFALFRNLSYISVTTARDTAFGDPNPPSVTVNANDWVVIAGYQDDDVQPIAAPANYTLISSVSQGTAEFGFTVAAAYRSDLSAGTEDPGIMTSTGDDPWAAATIILRPV